MTGKQAKLRERLLRNLAEFATPSVYDSQKIYSHNIWEKKVRTLRKLGIDIGQNVAIDRGFDWILRKSLRIGDLTSIGKNFKAYNFNEMEIEKFCMFVGEVQLTNGTHDTRDFTPSCGEAEGYL